MADIYFFYLFCHIFLHCVNLDLACFGTVHRMNNYHTKRVNNSEF